MDVGPVVGIAAVDDDADCLELGFLEAVEGRLVAFSGAGVFAERFSVPDQFEGVFARTRNKPDRDAVDLAIFFKLNLQPLALAKGCPFGLGIAVQNIERRMPRLGFAGSGLGNAGDRLGIIYGFFFCVVFFCFCGAGALTNF